MITFDADLFEIIRTSASNVTSLKIKHFFKRDDLSGQSDQKKQILEKISQMNLTHLELDYETRLNRQGSGFEVLSSMRALQSLKVYGEYLLSKDVSFLEELPNLRSLFLADKSIVEDLRNGNKKVFPNLERLIKLPSLENLTVRLRGITESGIWRMAQQELERINPGKKNLTLELPYLSARAYPFTENVTSLCNFPALKKVTLYFDQASPYHVDPVGPLRRECPELEVQKVFVPSYIFWGSYI
jgi:hypothetical protein